MSKAAIVSYDTNKGLKLQGENIGSILGLFCGGLPIETINTIFSKDFNEQFINIIKEGNIIKESEKIFYIKESIDEKSIIETVYNGTNAKFDEILSKLKRKQDITTDIKAKQIIRMSFALFLKIGHAAADFVKLVESKEPPQALLEKITSLYRTANKMKNWYVEKKQVLAELSEEDFERSCKGLLDKVKNKIDFLLKFKFCTMEEQKELRNESRGICKINIMQLAIDFLQNDTTVDQVITELERCYLQGMTLLAVFNICNIILKGITQKTSRIDTLTWITTILNRKDMNYWFYGTILACGITYRELLREQQFVLLGEVLKVLTISNDTEELDCLFEMLKWNYTTGDHELIKKLNLLNTLHDSSAKTEISYERYKKYKLNQCKWIHSRFNRRLYSTDNVYYQIPQHFKAVSLLKSVSGKGSAL